MRPPRFGTDGVRGVAGVDVTAELALALGRAAARTLPGATFAVGRDTRRSGPMLQGALMAGLAAEGADVVDLGVLPTPGVAHVAATRGAAGAVVSASHNPFADNGIKLFGVGGTKLAVEVEATVEAELEALLAEGPTAPPAASGERIGRVAPDPEGRAGYLRHLGDVLHGRRLDGLGLVLDCAQGAAFEVAPEVFASLGATVAARATAPDGANINDACGSTHPERLCDAVVAEGAELGLAFDGDADRLVAVDHTGSPVDGDRLLALFADDLASRGELAGDAVVVTVMTNLWFRRWAADRGIAVHETPVGDRHVLAALDDLDLVLGGEQSGHIVFRRRATTGDGVLSGLVLADLLRRRGRRLAELVAELPEPVPQVLVNCPVEDPGAVVASETVRAGVATLEKHLGDRGRVLVRASGTEPLVRIMVEAVDDRLAAEAIEHLRAAVEQVR